MRFLLPALMAIGFLGLGPEALAVDERPVRGHVILFSAEGELLQGIDLKLISAEEESRFSTGDTGIGYFESSSPLFQLIATCPNGQTLEITNITARAGDDLEVLSTIDCSTTPPSTVEVDIEGLNMSQTEQTTEKAVPGKLEIQVLDEKTEEPIESVQLAIRGVRERLKTNAKGLIQLELPSGSYDITFIKRQYQSSTQPQVQIRANENDKLVVALKASVARLATYTVTAPRLEGGTTALVEEKRESDAAVDLIGAEFFSKTGDSSAASALKRVPGLTLVDGKFVYIRGMGDRYSSAFLNGTPLASPEPQVRVVPLDLFPTAILESIAIQKAYSADQPGEFGAGVIQMETREYPKEFDLSVEFSTKYNSNSTFQESLTDRGSSTDWLGYDDGTRALPQSVADATANGLLAKETLFAPGLTAEELADLGKAFDETLYAVSNRELPPGFGTEVSLGDSFSFGTDITAGYRLSLMYGRDFTRKTFKRRNFDYNINLDLWEAGDDFDFQRTQLETEAAYFATGGIDFGETQSIQLTSFVNRLSTNKLEYFEGYFLDDQNDIQATRIIWTERMMGFHQAIGEHEILPDKLMKLTWRGAYSDSSQDEPDQRQFRYEYSDNVEAFILSDRPEGNNRMYGLGDDEFISGNLDLEGRIDFSDAYALEWKTGMMLSKRTRGYQLRRFKYAGYNVSRDIESLRPEEIFADQYIGTDENGAIIFELQEFTRNTDSYNGKANNQAFYVTTLHELGQYWDVSIGIRAETNKMNVETLKLFADEKVVSEKDYLDYLPALNVTYYLNDETQIRLDVSQTINLPSFRELSPNAYDNDEEGLTITGNPAVERAIVRTLGTRIEYYPEAQEWVTVGGFVKEFESPIEDIRVSGATPQKTFANAKSALNVGAELDWRISLGRLAKPARDFYFTGNLTYIQSEIELDTSIGT